MAQFARMKLIGLIVIAMASLSPAIAAHSEISSDVGAIYEITLVRDSRSSSGSSFDRETIFERVIGARPEGLELEYDLPEATTAEERARNWQFPARVFRPKEGPPRLINRSDLETRVEAWLKAAQFTRAACGHWIFTWTAFRIECDPQSVIEALKPFDLRSVEMREGAPYQDDGALAPARLVRKKGGSDGATFTATMKVDPEAFRRDRAEADVIVGEITNEPVTLDAALRQRAKETPSGTISVTFETDASGQMRRRIKVTKVQIRGADPVSETETVTETVVRRLVSAGPAGR
jgi:hypothetical protein